MRTWIVAIATTGRASSLERTLRSLIGSGAAEAGCRIVIAENGGTERQKSIVENYSALCPIEYLMIRERGKTPALNVIINRYSDRFIWFVDDDIRTTREAVLAYRAVAAIKRPGEYYGGPLGVDYETLPQDWLRPFLPRSALGWALDKQDDVNPPIRFLGANWGAWSDDIIAAGGFNQMLGPGRAGLGDEEDIQDRLLGLGLRPVYLPDALVYHWVPRDRCSPRWVLKRAFLIGKAEGLRHKPDGKSLCGIPRWMYRELLSKTTNWVRHQLSRYPQERFQSTYELAYFLGWIVGTRRSR